MKALLALVCAGIGLAQTPGRQAFEQTCGSGYCHNGQGVGGGAPRLAARGFDLGYIRTTVTNGIAGTSMPAFGQSLRAAELEAIISYVGRLNGSGLSYRGDLRGRLTGEAARGQALFSEAVRGFGRCSTCHDVNGLGIPIAAPISEVPRNAAALKSLTTPRVSTATVDGETMPALVVAARSASVTFYDLTSAVPVKRTVAPGSYSNREGSAWRHASVIGSYSDAELTTILAFLKAAR